MSNQVTLSLEQNVVLIRHNQNSYGSFVRQLTGKYCVPRGIITDIL